MLTSKHRRDVFPQPMPELRHPSQSAAPLLIPADHEGLAFAQGRTRTHSLSPGVHDEMFPPLPLVELRSRCWHGWGLKNKYLCHSD